MRFDDKAMRVWPAADAAERFAVVHAGTRWVRKSWSEQRWIETCRALLDRVPRIVLSSGPDPEERAMNGRIRAALGESAISTDGQTDWCQLAWLLSRAKLFVGVDTAAMHLAAACQCPTVALFGGSKIFEWYPWRVRSAVVRAQDWLGEEVALKDEELMKEIRADHVIAACDDILSGGGKVRPAGSALTVAA